MFAFSSSGVKFLFTSALKSFRLLALALAFEGRNSDFKLLRSNSLCPIDHLLELGCKWPTTMATQRNRGQIVTFGMVCVLAVIHKCVIVFTVHCTRGKQIPNGITISVHHPSYPHQWMFAWAEKNIAVCCVQLSVMHSSVIRVSSKTILSTCKIHVLVCKITSNDSILFGKSSKLIHVDCK